MNDIVISQLIASPVAPRHFREGISCYLVVSRIPWGLTGQIRGEVGTLLRPALTQITRWVAFFASYQRDGLIIKGPSKGPSFAKLVQSLDLRPLARGAGKSDKIGHSR